MDHQDERKGVASELLSPGDEVDHFEIEHLIGRGGMGEVYLARDRVLGRQVALKLVRRKAFGDGQALERFLHEARVTARFNHPNIVTAYSVGDHQGTPYVALEYIEGETLRSRMDKGPIPGRVAAAIGLAMARALAEAHEHNVLHRDLKPENVLISPDGRARVVDFGLAKAIDPPDMGLAATESPSTVSAKPRLGGDFFETKDRGVTGTPFYMAPEQWTGQEVTEATDVWALGVILHEMLAGERPFPGRTVFVLCGNVCASTPAPSVASREDVPPLLASLVARCLAKDPASRPSAAEIALRLEQLEGGDGRRRAPPLWWLALAAALVLALVLAILAISTRVPSRSPHDATLGDGGGSLAPLFPPRMLSARRNLRIGVSDLSELRGSDLAPGIFWGLLHTEPDGRELPFLVLEQPSLENGGAAPAAGGGLEVTWRLRGGLRWSDGHPLDAEDLVFALQVRGDSHVQSVRAPDSQTLIVLWDDAVRSAIESIRPLPRHVLQGVFETAGSEGVLEHLRVHATPTVGPYRVEEFVAGEGMVLLANPHFLGPAPAIERIDVVVAGPDELLRRFADGEIDLVAPDAVSLEQARAFQSRRAEAVHIRPSNTLFFLQPDMSIPFLDRVQVRRAILTAVDREELTDAVYGTEGRVAHVPLLAAPAGTATYEHSPVAARAALDASGASEIQLVLTHGPSGAEEVMAELAAEDLRAAGLDIQMRRETVRNLRKAFRGGRHGGLLLNSERVFDGAGVLPHWNLPRRAGGFDLSHRHSGYDDWVAALVDRESRALHADRRSQLRDALWVAYSERLPQLPLAFSAERVVVDASLRGWDQRPGDRFGRGLEQWYFAGPPQATSLYRRAPFFRGGLRFPLLAAGGRPRAVGASPLP